MQTHDDVGECLRALRAALAQVLEHVDDLSSAVDRLVAEARRRGMTHQGARPSLLIDSPTFSVQWHGRRCHLGNTLSFRLFQSLARRPDTYIATDSLMKEIWSGHRSRSTVRSAVCDLRRRLSEAGMSDLAARINGGTRGHYALLLAGT